MRDAVCPDARLHPRPPHPGHDPGQLPQRHRASTTISTRSKRPDWPTTTSPLSSPKRNTRFQYKLIKKGGRASEFENAIEWLCLSGIVSQVYRVEKVKKPLENYRDIDAFKIYVSDLGLLCAKKDLLANDVLYMVEELNDFKGGMAENYVQVQLTINGYHTYYWESERGAEVDFIIQREGQLIPIEGSSPRITPRPRV
ncbi:MAG: DUF4143 domain-containing protein [Dysosmobacter sp.]